MSEAGEFVRKFPQSDIDYREPMAWKPVFRERNTIQEPFNKGRYESGIQIANNHRLPDNFQKRKDPLVDDLSD